MTKIEAAEKLKAILEEATEDENAVCYVTSCDADALDMAIKALEQTEPEKHGDCISRQELLNAISQKEYGHDYDENTDILGLKYVDIIKRMPSVEPERKTGKWEYIQYDGNPKIGNWHCSNCRLIVNLGFEGKPYYHYCPSCGARMKVDDE